LQYETNKFSNRFYFKCHFASKLLEIDLLISVLFEFTFA